MMEIGRPADIADVKAGINAGRLYVQIKDGLLMLGDYQTGEVVRLSDIEVKPVVHARWIAEYKEICSACKTEFDDDMFWIQGELKTPNYCPNCGARMDSPAE